MKEGKKYIVYLLIISLLVPSFVGILWTSNAYAFIGLEDSKMKDGFYSVLKGLAMLFLLNRVIDKDEPVDNSLPAESNGSPINSNGSSEQSSQDSPIKEEPQSSPTGSDKSTSGESPTDNDSVDIIVEEPPATEGDNSLQKSWTSVEVKGLTAAEKKMLELVNQERQKRGLKPLKFDLRLVKVARAKSRDMIENNYFDHQSPTFGSPFDMMKEINIFYTLAGENIAGAPTVKQAHEALMDSKGHRENILRPRFTHVGIGIVEGSKYGMMFSQEFIDVD